MKHLTILFGVSPHSNPTLSNSLWNFENRDAETTCSEEEHHEIEDLTHPLSCFGNDNGSHGPVAGSGELALKLNLRLMLQLADNLPVRLQVKAEDGLLVE